MAESVKKDYEVSGSVVSSIRVSYARLADTTPTPSNPARVTGLLAGKQITGVVLSLDAAKSQAIIDVTPGNVYLEDVRNILTYNGGAENTFGAINEGDPIYYDASSTMPAGIYLSTSPLDKDGAANPIFGRAVLKSSEDTFPKGTTTVSNQRLAVLIVGAGL